MLAAAEAEAVSAPVRPGSEDRGGEALAVQELRTVRAAQQTQAEAEAAGMTVETADQV